MIKKISKDIQKTFKKMLRPKGKFTIRDLATIRLAVCSSRFECNYDNI